MVQQKIFKYIKSKQTFKTIKKRRYLKIKDKIELVDGKRKISIEPSESIFRSKLSIKLFK